MAKTPDEVIAKLQRRLENSAQHTTGLIDKLAGWKKMAKRLEDTLAYTHRQLAHLRDEDPAIKNALEAIERVIPTRLRCGREETSE